MLKSFAVKAFSVFLPTTSLKSILSQKAIPFGLVAKASPAHRKVMIGYLQLEAEFVRIGIAAMLSDINQKRGKRTITIG
jgi:hypothetical protein